MNILTLTIEVLRVLEVSGCHCGGDSVGHIVGQVQIGGHSVCHSGCDSGGHIGGHSGCDSVFDSGSKLPSIHLVKC